MGNATDIRLCDVRTSTEQISYRTPIKFGGRVVTDVVLLNIEVDVETATGNRAVGYGSMPLGNAWAWPSGCVTAADTLRAMLEFGERTAKSAGRCRVVGHPLEITMSLAREHSPIATQLARDLALAEPIPRLAQLVAASPLEAAIHDAYGRAHGRNSYELLGRDFVAEDLAHYLGSEFKGEYLDRYVLATPQSRLPLYHLVGALDPLTAADLTKPVGDGLPETLGEWIAYNGLTHLKIKLAGDNLNWDVDRVAAVEIVAVAAQAACGCRTWCYSLDFNEKCASVEYVLEFLEKLRERSPLAYERVQYIEQPTHRDLHRFPNNRMHAAAKLKPVVIDESLLDFASLLLARELGYSGVALKTCKGQTEALLLGAAAQKFGMFLCVQDLTCVGRSFLHSASLAARMPTVAAIEGNGRQYCPAGNRNWEDRYPSMFHITDGTVGTHALTGNGLGF